MRSSVLRIKSEHEFIKISHVDDDICYARACYFVFEWIYLSMSRIVVAVLTVRWQHVSLK